MGSYPIAIIFIRWYFCHKSQVNLCASPFGLRVQPALNYSILKLSKKRTMFYDVNKMTVTRGYQGW